MKGPGANAAVEHPDVEEAGWWSASWCGDTLPVVFTIARTTTSVCRFQTTRPAHESEISTLPPLQIEPLSLTASQCALD